MDHDHRRRNSCWRIASFFRINLWLVLVCFGAYLLNRFYLKHLTANGFIHDYLNDALAGTLLPAYSNALISATPLKDRVLVTPIQIFALICGAGLFWEYVTPIYWHSTSDPLDVVAYVCGGSIYYVIVRVVGKLPLETVVE
jgi:hypothetical protein